jgi:hypothetical protein
VHGRNELDQDRGIGWVRLLWNQLTSAVVLRLGAGIIGFVVAGVERDDRRDEIDSAELVPGDIVDARPIAALSDAVTDP